MSADSERLGDSDFHPVTAAQVSQLGQDLRDRGVATLHGAISPKWLATAREEILAYVGRHGPGDHDLFDHEDWECPAIRGMADNPQIEALLRTLSTPSSTSTAAGTETYDRRLLRIHDGTGGNIPNSWHYDANTVTAMIPLVVPGGDAGKFAYLPPQRPLRRTVLATVQERIRVGKDPYPGATAKFNKAADGNSYPLVPGELLIFMGSRTLHTALPWPVGEWRANVVLHYGHPAKSESAPLRAALAMRDAIKSKL